VFVFREEIVRLEGYLAQGSLGDSTAPTCRTLSARGHERARRRRHLARFHHMGGSRRPPRRDTPETCRGLAQVKKKDKIRTIDGISVKISRQ
jgi:hypothetical protein